jgi:2,4-dienoyl-CoA reductase-like NADH-dependent reductase (Old Yellow Enzyme family)
MSSALFQPITLRGVTLANRVVVAPMCQYEAHDGMANDWHLMHLGQYAMGAAGLVFTEATAVVPEGRISPGCLSLHSDETEAALKRVVDFCDKHGVVTMGIQLAHAGRKASTAVPLEGGQPLAASEGGWQTVAPSAVPYADWPTPQALSVADIGELKSAFAAAARRAHRIGFRVIELHAAHGYLMHEFLSPLSNRREDDYGGSLENRMRLPLEVFQAVREVLPEDTVLGVRVSATDWIDGGWTPEETVALSAELKALGCDFMDVSSGGNDPAQQIPLGPGYQVAFAEKVRREAGIPTMAVGMITRPQQAEAIVASGQADMVALARGMMFDPRWAWHAAEALGAETPYADNYIRCHPARWPQVFPWAEAAE